MGRRILKIDPELGAQVNGLERKPRLLLVDSASETIEHTTQALNGLGIDVAGALTGEDGLAAARRAPYDLLLTDMRLPDMHAMSLVKQLQAENNRVPFVLMSYRPKVRAVVEAMQLGALAVLTKPLDLTEVVILIRSTRQSNGHQKTGPAPRPRDAERVAAAATPSRYGSPVERWAHFVLDTIATPQDPKTMSEWARAVGVSRSVLAENCRLVHISPREARDFARALRAVCRAGARWEPELLLNCAEARTLNKLLKRAGLPGSGAPTPSVDEFLRQQQWIPANSAKLDAVLALLPTRRHANAHRYD
jgi:CheY-like chemotaxis protein